MYKDPKGNKSYFPLFRTVIFNKVFLIVRFKPTDLGGGTAFLVSSFVLKFSPLVYEDFTSLKRSNFHLYISHRGVSIPSAKPWASTSVEAATEDFTNLVTLYP